jgi:phosphoribosylformylglycinamidine synthase
MFIARIRIMLKPTVRDAQGATVEKALKNLGYEEVSDLRIGRQIVVKLDGQQEQEVRRRVEEMCQKLLANPVIEDYEVEITVAEPTSPSSA